MTPRVEVIWAEDELLAEEAVAALRAALPQGAECLTLEAEASGVPGLAEAMTAASLFATDRLVVVRGAERLGAGGLRELAAALEGGGRAASAVAVVAVSDRPPPALLRELGSLGGVRRLPRPRRGELVAWVARRLREAGVRADREAAAVLVEAVGTGLRELDQAVRQVAARAGPGGTVGAQQVADLFGGLAAQPGWVLFDAVVARDGPRAFRVLHSMLASGADPMGVLFGFVSQLRLVMRARSALERSPGLSEAALAQALGVSQGRAAVLRRQAARLSWEWLVRTHRRCADADFELKGGDEIRVVGVLPPQLVVERVIDAALQDGRAGA